MIFSWSTLVGRKSSIQLVAIFKEGIGSRSSLMGNVSSRFFEAPQTRTGNHFYDAKEMNFTEPPIPDRFGNMVKPREWFLVPLNVIDDAVQRIRDRSILEYSYDPQTAALVRQVEAR